MATEPAGAFTVRFAERAGDLGAAAAAPGAVAVADASTYSLEGTTVAEGRRETTTFAVGRRIQRHGREYQGTLTWRGSHS